MTRGPSFLAALILSGLLLLPGAARGDAVRNGNETALAYREAAGEAERARLDAEHLGLIHTFRFLEVTAVVTGKTDAVTQVVTREPSSDAVVILLPHGSRSAALAGQLAVGECVTGKGRIKKRSGPEPLQILVDPALLQHKDRCAPKRGEELLREVDPRAH